MVSHGLSECSHLLKGLASHVELTSVVCFFSNDSQADTLPQLLLRWQPRERLPGPGSRFSESTPLPRNERAKGKDFTESGQIPFLTKTLFGHLEQRMQARERLGNEVIGVRGK